jgi:hypothetical protein
MKPCPRCSIAHWQTGGQTRIRYIPEFMELCRDCCDPGEIELRGKEKEQFKEFVLKERDEQIRRKCTCDNLILSKKLF